MDRFDLKNIKDEIYSRLFDHIDRAFPAMNFQRNRSNWISKYHLDGTADSSGNVVTYIYDNNRSLAIDYARGNKALIDLYMEQNGKTFFEALKELADIAGVKIPEQNREEWESQRKSHDNMTDAFKKFQTALWEDTPEAKRVLSYLRDKRRWSDESIKKAGLGLATKAVLRTLSDMRPFDSSFWYNGKQVGSIGTSHCLAIPFMSGSVVKGFKFRKVDYNEATDKPMKVAKYLNTIGIEKGSAFCGLKIGVKDLVIVESELDALHAQALGFDNVVATAGGKVSAEQAADAVRKGVEKFTLLFDNDESGHSFIAQSVDKIPATSSVYVTSIPAEADGRAVKDVDEYLALHTVEELKEVIATAKPYSFFRIDDIVRKYAKMEDNSNGLSFKQREDLMDEFIGVLNSPRTDIRDRKILKDYLKGFEKDLCFDFSDFEAVADKAYYIEVEKERREEVKNAGERIYKAIKEGRTDEALRLMKTTSSEQSTKARSLEYEEDFSTMTPEEWSQYLSEVKAGVPTGYKFGDNNNTEPLTLNPGLTFICGYRGHGKTTFLNNIALNVARRNLERKNGESVFYYSYEVDKRRLVASLLSTYIDNKNISANPSQSILYYFMGEKYGGFKRANIPNSQLQETIKDFEAKKDYFLKNYLGTGALTIVDKTYKVEKLLEAIKYGIRSRKPSIVCIDYAQLLYSEDFSRQRTEEIKKVVNDIKDFANKEQIPFVLAAQFNRDVESPISVDTKNIGEGGDFERIADTCVGLYNLKELHPLPKQKDEDRMAKSLLERMSLRDTGDKSDLMPIHDKLFARIMKRRYGKAPVDHVFDWNGATGKISLNDGENLLKDSINSLSSLDITQIRPF